MKPNDLIEVSRRLHAWADNYQDVIGQDFARLVSKLGIDDAERLGTSIGAMREEGRLITIGIVGRVKAGKSSLLNALIFDGQPVLPKAATPMTAALTTLSFGETFRAEVQYFTPADLQKIEVDAAKFKARLVLLENEINNKLMAQARDRDGVPDMDKTRELAERQALRAATEESPSSSASWDQWRRIQSALSGTYDSRPDSIDAASPEELASRLMDFVGPDGQYMPFTKSVDIYLPIEWLRDIRIVDTPGMDDPVRSREERTRQLLKDCDVIFIVSPAGQFLNQQDIEAMSLISRREGVRHIAVVASQIDNQLFASAKKVTPEATLEGITQQLRGHMKDTLSRLVASNPEFAGVFDNLIHGGEEVLTWTSSACAGLANRLNDESDWDATDHTLWKNLGKAFPEFFDGANSQRSLDSLQLISNVARLKVMMDDVRRRKVKVLAGRVDEWAVAKSDSLNDFKKALVDQVNARIFELEGTNVEALIRQQRKLQNIVSRGGNEIDEAFAKWKDDFLSRMDVELHKALSSVFDEAMERSSSAKEIDETECTKKGIANWLADALWDGGKETGKALVVYTQPALAGLAHFIRRHNKDIATKSREITRGARKELEMTLTLSARHYLEQVYQLDAGSADHELETETIVSWIDRAVMDVVSKLRVPPPSAVAVEREWPSERKLTGDAARKFFEDVRSQIWGLREKAIEELDAYCLSLEKKIQDHVADIIFDELRDRTDRLIKDIKNIAMSRERFGRMARQLATA